MKNWEDRVKDWCRSLGSTFAAALIVAAILGVLYITPRPTARNGLAIKSGRAPTLTAEKAGDGGPGQVSRPTQHGKDGARRGGNKEDDETTERTSAASGVGSGSRTEEGFGARVAATTLGGPTPTADGKVSGVVPKAEAVKRKQSAAAWDRDLRLLHDRICKPGRGSVAAKKEAQEKAEAGLDAIDDSRAVPAIRRHLARYPKHHQLVARMLAHIESAESTRMLADLAVYSVEEKARWGARNALRDRDAAEFLGPLTGLFNNVNYQAKWENVPDLGQSRILVIEEDRVIRRYIFPPPDKAPPPGNSRGVYTPFNPFMLEEDRREAILHNQAQADQARLTTEQQFNLAIEQAKRFQQDSRELTDRAVTALREATGQRSLPPDREAWKEWVAQLKGRTYIRPRGTLKQEIVQVMPPLFNPTFTPIPDPT